METLNLIQDISVIMVVAGITTVLCKLLRQPVIFGFLIAGIIIGPHTRPFSMVKEETTIRGMADMGIVLLIFGAGLNFNISKIMNAGMPIFIVALFEIGMMLFVGYRTGLLFGWKHTDSLFLGAICSISSTALILRGLQEENLMREESSEAILGVAIFEDIFSITLIVLLSGLASLGVHEESVSLVKIGLTLGNILLFVVTVTVSGLLIFPYLLDFISKFKNEEILLIASLGLCFGISLIAAKLNYSIALGAFLTGAIIAETKHGQRIDRLTTPVKNVFSAVFFVSMGMLIDFKAVSNLVLPIIVVTMIVLLGKTFFCGLGFIATGHSPSKAISSGARMAQIGEFSFIISQFGKTSGIISPLIYPMVVIVSAMTAFLNHILVSYSWIFLHIFKKIIPVNFRKRMEFLLLWLNRINKTDRESGRISAYAIVRRITLMTILDIIMITGIFAGASSLIESRLIGFAVIPEKFGGTASIAWTFAIIVTLPLFVHLFYNLRSLSMIFAELGVPRKKDGASNYGSRSIISNLIRAALTLIISLWFIFLTLSFLPPWPVLVFLLISLVLIISFMAKKILAIYTKAQIMILELFQSSDYVSQFYEHEMPGSSIGRIKIPARYSAISIKELHLRSITGATVIGILRENENIVNPGPDDRLMPNDTVFVFGIEEQIEKARELILSSHDK